MPNPDTTLTEDSGRLPAAHGSLPTPRSDKFEASRKWADCEEWDNFARGLERELADIHNYLSRMARQLRRRRDAARNDDVAMNLTAQMCAIHKVRRYVRQRAENSRISESHEE